MSLANVMLLNAQLILGADVSQGYNSNVFTEGGIPQAATATIVQPRLVLRLLNPMSDYQLEYGGGYSFYGFDIVDSELSHRAEIRGQWQVSEDGTADALEQITYGSGNTLRQLELTTAAAPEISAARTRYIMNHGRVTYRVDIGETTQFDVNATYLLRRTLDAVETDTPIFNYDTFAPEAELGFTRALDDDNNLGLRLGYAHYLSPAAPGGSYFENDGRLAANAGLTYLHRFQTWWSATAEAGAVYARALDSDPPSAFLGPTAGVGSMFRGPRFTIRVSYEHGFGAYGEQSGSAVFDGLGLFVGFDPRPLRQDITFYAELDSRRSLEVLGELALEHDTLGTTVGTRYEVNDYFNLYASYDWRFQRTIGTAGGESDAAFRRHIVTIGIVGQYAFPRRLNVGEQEEEEGESEGGGF